eukprot:6219243-Prymnesium_polylepis.4
MSWTQTAAMPPTGAHCLDWRYEAQHPPGGRPISVQHPRMFVGILHLRRGVSNSRAAVSTVQPPCICSAVAPHCAAGREGPAPARRHLAK